MGQLIYYDSNFKFCNLHKFYVIKITLLQKIVLFIFFNLCLVFLAFLPNPFKLCSSMLNYIWMQNDHAAF